MKEKQTRILYSLTVLFSLTLLFLSQALFSGTTSAPKAEPGLAATAQSLAALAHNQFGSDAARLENQSELSREDVLKWASAFTVEVWINLQDGTEAPANGIIVGHGDYVITNSHVVRNNPHPKVRSLGETGVVKEYSGHVVAERPAKDLALIALEGVSGLPTAPLATSTKSVGPGDQVYMVGSPRGSHWKLTESEVLRTDSTCGILRLLCIRSAAGALAPGNSGGPLLNKGGEVIGINRAIQISTGEGVSIPIEEVLKFLSDSGIPLPRSKQQEL
ncbi:MAG: trypsin-like peptidase domain-containing protein [Candidatus Melainabacteria bacterium]|nr:trypsin-like peptidase domain-containing protein [Candidatus Melainabacteria bacterium]